MPDQPDYTLLSAEDGGYDFHRIQHGAILGHALLIGLTPLIPIPFLDDWVKSALQRRMARQIATSRGVLLDDNQVEALIQEDFWDSCVGSCLQGFFYLLRELLSKILFFLEFRRGFRLFSQTYYNGFLLDAALLEKLPIGTVEEAAQMREAIRRARYGANFLLIRRLLRETVRPAALLRAAGTLAKQAIRGLPGILSVLPGAVWRGLRDTPGTVARGVRGIPARIRENFYLRVQVLLGKQKAPEIKAIERMAMTMQTALLQMDSSHFDELVVKLKSELRGASTKPGATGGNAA